MVYALCGDLVEKAGRDCSIKAADEVPRECGEVPNE